jgi:hypothetical protein
MFSPRIKNHVILHNPLIGRILVAAFIALASWKYGWQGFVVAITFWVFWLLLQFGQTLRFMRLVAQRTVGEITDINAFEKILRTNMSMLQIIQHTQCLGTALPLNTALSQSLNPSKAQGADQCWQWRDPQGHCVIVFIRHERCQYWERHDTYSG